MLLILFEYAVLLAEQISYRDVSLVRCDVRKARTRFTYEHFSCG